MCHPVNEEDRSIRDLEQSRAPQPTAERASRSTSVRMTRNDKPSTMRAADGEYHPQGSVPERGGGGQSAELRGHPDRDVDRDEHGRDLERGSVVDPRRPGQGRGDEHPRQPGEEDLLGGCQPVVQSVECPFHGSAPGAAAALVAAQVVMLYSSASRRCPSKHHWTAAMLASSLLPVVGPPLQVVGTPSYDTVPPAACRINSATRSSARAILSIWGSTSSHSRCSMASRMPGSVLTPYPV